MPGSHKPTGKTDPLVEFTVKDLSSSLQALLTVQKSTVEGFPLHLGHGVGRSSYVIASEFNSQLIILLIFSLLIRWYSTYAHKVAMLLIVYSPCPKESQKLNQETKKEKKIQCIEHLFCEIYYAK